MLRRTISRIITMLTLMGLSLSTPLFAANVQPVNTPTQQSTLTPSKTKKTTVAKKAKSTKHKKKHTKTSAKAANTSKKIATHPTKKHHSKATSHHHSSPSLNTALTKNPQDYAPVVNNQSLAASITSNSSANNQDLMNGGFNQQISSRLASSRSAVCANAQAQVGKPYQWGAEDPDAGFDCSGLSQFVYAQEGIKIPRTALEQYQSLQPVKHLQEGDLVFFRTHANSRKVSHVGIYVGDGYFVHSPRTGETIRMSRLDDKYWRQHYAGARRVLTKQTVANTVALNKAPVQDENC